MVPLLTLPIPVQNEEKTHNKVPNNDELVTPKSKKTNNQNLNSIFFLSISFNILINNPLIKFIKI